MKTPLRMQRRLIHQLSPVSEVVRTEESKDSLVNLISELCQTPGGLVLSIFNQLREARRRTYFGIWTPGFEEESLHDQTEHPNCTPGQTVIDASIENLFISLPHGELLGQAACLHQALLYWRDLLAEDKEDPPAVLVCAGDKVLLPQEGMFSPVLLRQHEGDQPFQLGLRKYTPGRKDIWKNSSFAIAFNDDRLRRPHPRYAFPDITDQRSGPVQDIEEIFNREPVGTQR